VVRKEAEAAADEAASVAEAASCASRYTFRFYNIRLCLNRTIFIEDFAGIPTNVSASGRTRRAGLFGDFVWYRPGLRQCLCRSKSAEFSPAGPT
jgi:hypothetical protein